MKITGIIMTIIGAILLVITFLPADGDLLDRGEGIYWSFTWASMLGIFIFFAGTALLVANYNRNKQEKNQNKKEACN